MPSYSIADAKDRFAAIVHEAEQSTPVEITRRGQPVAILLSVADYERLRRAHHPFWSAYEAFRQQHDLATAAIEPELFADARSRETGRDVTV